VVAHTCNPGTQAQAGGSRVGGQHGLHSETLSQKQTKPKKAGMGRVLLNLFICLSIYLSIYLYIYLFI
jgi:hypothetical protein